jgi:capsular polysaccharide biosynthesis protein
VVKPRIALTRPLPTGQPADHFAFARRLRACVPPAIVARLPQGRVVGPYGAVVTADDTLLFDLSPYYGAYRPSQHPILLNLRLPAVVTQAGSVAVLTTRGVDNYYHFMLDVLPRLELLRRAGIDPDRYLVNRALPFQKELLARVGIPEERTIESSSEPHIRAEDLVVPSLPDCHLETPPWVTTWLRQTLLLSEGTPHRRLFIGRGSRKHTRRIVNQDQVVAALEPYGFETIDPGTMSVAQQIATFTEAEIVVGVHGAALTNLVFCPAGAAVVELFPPDYVNACYWTLASAHGAIRYRYLVGNGLPTRSRQTHRVDADVTVDARQLVHLIDDLIQHTAETQDR